MNSKSKISVVIPTWNGSKTIAACISSLQKQTHPPTEIIVVANGSSDGTPDIVSRGFPKVKLIRLPKNTGVSGGRNTGIQAAEKKSEYIFIFDHDMTADTEMLEKLLETARKNSADIVTPKIYYKKSNNHIWSAGTGINLWTGQVLFRNGIDRGQYNRDEKVQVTPAAMLISQQVVNTIGNFDERIFASWEDTELCFRASKAGFKIYYSSQAVAYHDLSLDSRDEAMRLLNRYPFQIGRNRIVFMRRFGKSWPVFLAFLPVYIFYYGWLALRYKQFRGYWIFLEGTASGLIESAKIHR